MLIYKSELSLKIEIKIPKHSLTNHWTITDSMSEVALMICVVATINEVLIFCPVNLKAFNSDREQPPMK